MSTSLLDCTLRDGGYLNDWKFGRDNILFIFSHLVKARIDFIEVGFLDERREYDQDATIFPNTESINKTFEGMDKGRSKVVAMIDYGTCGLENIQPRSETFIDGIRVIFKEKKAKGALEFCSQLKELGYMVFAQAVSITTYSDESLAALVDDINSRDLDCFSLVDTYGLLNGDDLLKKTSLVLERMVKRTGLGFHSHNNFQLAFSNCRAFMHQPLGDRFSVVDGSLYGMGKSAGNAPTELLAMELNNCFNSGFDMNEILEIIDTTVMDLSKEFRWGYTEDFFISSEQKCHPNYVKYLREKKKLTIKMIHEILGELPEAERLMYNESLVQSLYLRSQMSRDTHSGDRESIESLVRGRSVLIVADNSSLYEHLEVINSFIAQEDPIVISMNFIPKGIKLDYLFASNVKKYERVLSCAQPDGRSFPGIIATSNVPRDGEAFTYVLDYGSMLVDFANEATADNPMLMLTKLFAGMNVKQLCFAGCDGYTHVLRSSKRVDNSPYVDDAAYAAATNNDISRCLGILAGNVKVRFITPSRYTVKAEQV